MRLDAHHLRVVRAIAESGSVSKAAAALGISQPAVSTHLGRLEHLLGYPLFRRAGGGMVPTPMGESLLNRIGAVLPLMDRLDHDLVRNTCPSRPQATVRVGAVCSSMVRHVGAVVHEHCDGAGTSILNIDDCARLISLVAGRRLELGLVKDYPGFELSLPEEIEVATIVVEPTFAVLPAEHPLATRFTVELADLSQESWALPAVSSARFHEFFADVCAAAGFTPITGHIADSEEVILMAVRAGAVALLQPTCERKANLTVRALRGDPIRRRHLLCWHRDGFAAARWRPLRTALVDAYWTEARRSPVYRPYLPLPWPDDIPDTDLGFHLDHHR